MSRVVLLVPTATYRAEAFLAAADRLGVALTVASERRQLLAEVMGDRFVEIPLDDPPAAAAAIEAFAAAHPVDAVVAVDDQGLLAAALAAAGLGLRHHPPAAVAVTRDKVAMRHLLAAAGVRQPDFAACAAEPGEAVEAVVERAVERACRLGPPVVVKPPGLSASRGVIRADDPRQVRQAAARVIALLDRIGEPRRLVVERYVDGDEVALEGLVDDGRLTVLALFDKPDPLVGPYFEETIYVTPSRHAPEVQAAIAATAQAAATALGLTDGPVHAELRLPPGPDTEPVVLEVAARTIGGRCASALRFATGGSLEELVLAQALGRPLATAPAGGASGVMMLPIPASGRLVAVGGRDRAAKAPGVTALELSTPVGGTIEMLPDGDRYLGFLFARGDTPEEVEAALRAAHGELDVQVEPAGQVGPAGPVA